MEELLRYEKQLDNKLAQETERLLALGYTQKQIDALDRALEYIAYPIISEYFEHPESFYLDESEAPSNL